MAKAKQKTEQDSTYLIKVIFYLFIGSFWVRLSKNGGQYTALPVGFIVGILLARHEKLQLDRKIEYALLAVGVLVGFWLVPSLQILL